MEDDRDWGPKPFRFMNMWLKDPNCLKIAKEAWEEDVTMGWAGFVILKRMKRVKERIKVWNKEDFGDVNAALQNLEDKMHQFDVMEEGRQLNEEEKIQRNQTKEEYWKMSNAAEILWKQKARNTWLKLGDKNNRFFQMQANYRFKKNKLGSVLVDNRLIVTPEEIKEEAIKYFNNLFKEEKQARPGIGGVFFKKLPQETAREIQKPFEVAEIEMAIKGCSNSKAPGPDGFNFAFIKKAWGFLKEMVIKFFSEFYANGKLTRGINSNFTVLIPKVDNPISFKEYRPICLVG